MEAIGVAGSQGCDDPVREEAMMKPKKANASCSNEVSSALLFPTGKNETKARARARGTKCSEAKKLHLRGGKHVNGMGHNPPEM